MKISSKKLVTLITMTVAAIYLLDWNEYSFVKVLDQSNAFSVDIQANDVIVLLAIPATGTSSLAASLIKDLVTETPCICQANKTRCSCTNRYGNHWLFHASNATGRPCGDPADFTTLTECDVDDWFETIGRDNRAFRRYALVTLLREPAARFIAEWRDFVKGDDSMQNEPRLFRNQSAELQKKQLKCLLGRKIADLTLEQFLECSDNPAINRQTRMLANLTEVNRHGYHGDRYDKELLASAIHTVESLPFYGIFDLAMETERLMDETLGLRLSRPLLLAREDSKHPINMRDYSGPLIRRIRLANHLDVRLYNHALFLFQSRLKTVKNIPSQNDERFSLESKPDPGTPRTARVEDDENDPILAPNARLENKHDVREFVNDYNVRNNNNINSEDINNNKNNNINNKNIKKNNNVNSKEINNNNNINGKNILNNNNNNVDIETREDVDSNTNENDNYNNEDNNNNNNNNNIVDTKHILQPPPEIDSVDKDGGDFSMNDLLNFISDVQVSKSKMSGAVRTKANPKIDSTSDKSSALPAVSHQK